MEYAVWRVGEMIECVLFLFIMLWFGQPFVAWFLLLANQLIFMCGNLCVDDCMYYIDYTISHEMLLFSRWCEGAGDWYVFIGWLLSIDLNNRWPSQHRKPNQNWIPQLNERASKFWNMVNKKNWMRELEKLLTRSKLDDPILNWLTQLIVRP